MTAERPAVVTPLYLMNLEGFGDEARRSIELFSRQFGANSSGLLYTYKNEATSLNIVGDRVEAVADRIAGGARSVKRPPGDGHHRDRRPVGCLPPQVHLRAHRELRRRQFPRAPWTGPPGPRPWPGHPRRSGATGRGVVSRRRKRAGGPIHAEAGAGPLEPLFAVRGQVPGLVSEKAFLTGAGSARWHCAWRRRRGAPTSTSPILSR